MSLERVGSALGCACEPDFGRITVRRVSTDSRQVAAGDLFFAIPGERFDGHRFVAEAAAKGAAAGVCARDRVAAVAGDTAIPCLTVGDTVAALGRLAAYHRREVMPPTTVVVAITGSNGKTTAKCMIHHILSGSYKGRAAPRSFNNNIGVPLTLLSSEVDDRYLLVEIGTNGPGEVASLAAMVSPDVGVITSVGEAHVEGLGDVRAIAAEKASLLGHLRGGGLAVVNADSPELRSQVECDTGTRLLTFGFDARAELRVTKVRGTIRGTTFELKGGHRVELPLPGVHHATNAAAAFAVARWFGLGPEEIVARLRSLTPAQGRGRLVELRGVTLVDDAYNSNPASMAAAIETLRLVEGGRRVLVVGDMLELGSQSASLHRRIMRSIHDAGIEVVVAVGPATVKAAKEVEGLRGGPRVITCKDAEEACDAVPAVLSPGDTVWIKGSRAMELDRVVGRVKAHYRCRAAVA